MTAKVSDKKNRSYRNFIQWKGTDVCVDLYCDCGVHTHADGYFAYHLKCGKCGSVYQMANSVEMKKVEPKPDDSVLTTKYDEEEDV